MANYYKIKIVIKCVLLIRFSRMMKTFLFYHQFRTVLSNKKRGFQICKCSIQDLTKHEIKSQFGRMMINNKPKINLYRKYFSMKD